MLAHRRLSSGLHKLIRRYTRSPRRQRIFRMASRVTVFLYGRQIYGKMLLRRLRVDTPIYRFTSGVFRIISVPRCCPPQHWASMRPPSKQASHPAVFDCASKSTRISKQCFRHDFITRSSRPCCCPWLRPTGFLKRWDTLSKHV